MNTHQANVLIHVDETVESDQSAALEDMLGDISGVTRVRPTAKSHLTWVEYDPYVTGARTILGRVHSRGLHAQLIGL